MSHYYYYYLCKDISNGNYEIGEMGQLVIIEKSKKYLLFQGFLYS